MKKQIKETCSCGAIFEYSEDINPSWQEGMAFRQKEFHRAHEKCQKLEEIPHK